MKDVDKYGIPIEYKDLVEKGMSSTYYYWALDGEIPKDVINIAGEAASEVFFEVLDKFLESGEYMTRFVNKHRGLVRAIRNIELYTETHRAAQNRLWELERLLSSRGFDCNKLREEALK